MTTYQHAARMIELFKNDPSFEDVLIEVMKIQGWSDKQSRLFAIKSIIEKELQHNTKKQVKDMLVNNYGYSRSRAYALIQECETSQKYTQNKTNNC